MRFAGQAITIPSVRQNPEVLPSTEGVRYPEDNQPAGEFNGGEGVDPTYLPQMRQQIHAVSSRVVLHSSHLR